MLVLDKLFLKYEDGGTGGRGVKLTTPPPEKTTLKKSSLIRAKGVCGGGRGCLSVWVNPLKNENLWQKSFFQ